MQFNCELEDLFLILLSCSVYIVNGGAYLDGLLIFEPYLQDLGDDESPHH